MGVYQKIIENGYGAGLVVISFGYGVGLSLRSRVRVRSWRLCRQIEQSHIESGSHFADSSTFYSFYSWNYAISMAVLYVIIITECNHVSKQTISSYLSKPTKEQDWRPVGLFGSIVLHTNENTRYIFPMLRNKFTYFGHHVTLSGLWGTRQQSRINLTMCQSCLFYCNPTWLEANRATHAPPNPHRALLWSPPFYLPKGNVNPPAHPPPHEDRL